MTTKQFLSRAPAALAVAHLLGLPDQLAKRLTPGTKTRAPSQKIEHDFSHLKAKQSEHSQPPSKQKSVSPQDEASATAAKIIAAGMKRRNEI